MCMSGVIQIRVSTWVSARKISTSFIATVERLVTREQYATFVSGLLASDYNRQ